MVKALPIGLNLMLCAVSYGMFVSYGVLYGKEIDIQNTGMLFLFMAIGIGTSRLIAGRYVDKGLYTRCIIIFAVFADSCAGRIFAGA
ncbi:MAG: hypothetical protein LBG19_01210 [Prevotellaceae bacterium]|nr:hypothetical protein [Prevotellaceae bacterium]